jgi:hypothetical protein
LNEGRAVFAQLMEFFPRYEFNQCVQRYQGNYRIRQLSCYDQFLAMTFAQLTGRESLRDTVTCLKALGSRLYHAGFRGSTARSTLAEANEKRDWRIFADFAAVLIQQAKPLYAQESFGVELEQAAYALDSTIIELCLSLFPWARFRHYEAAIKIHALLDLKGNLPQTVFVTPARLHDVNILDRLVFEPGAIYIFDRAYLDFVRLHRIHRAPAFFITRARRNFRCRRLSSHRVEPDTGVICDQTIRLKSFYPLRGYPDQLRRIRYQDLQHPQRLIFLTNNFLLPASQIARLYQCRWQIELFFKWIKQHLRIKAFFGISQNAVKTQIWIAICVYVLVAIVKKHLKVETKLYEVLQILSVSLFEKMPILQVFSPNTLTLQEPEFSKQLELFDF